MMLPILISVSLAPGSYFFCALAADPASRNAVAIVRPTISAARLRIVLSLMMLARLSQPDSSRSSGANILRRGTGAVMALTPADQPPRQHPRPRPERRQTRAV